MRIEHPSLSITMTAKEFKECHTQVATLLNSITEGIDRASRLLSLETKLREKLPGETFEAVVSGKTMSFASPLDQETIELVNEYMRLKPAA